jgi:putative SOS response-associated peptidase YedK
MCGRFTLHTSPEKIAEQFGLAEVPYLAPRYNIAPTQPVGIVRLGDRGGDREWALVQWGLVPSWSKDPGIGARMINARSETAWEKPSFRAAFRRRRCLIPADGFYEWKSAGTANQPYYITVEGGTLFAFAGLWEVWIGPDGSELESCTILTTEANTTVAELHNRMPVILAADDYAEWLGARADAVGDQLIALRDLMRAYPAAATTVYAVSRTVSSPRNEGPECITPVGASHG